MSERVKRPRVLFLCLRNPWLLNNGGIIRNYWLVHALAERFDVDLVTADDAQPPVPPAFAALTSGVYRFSRATGTRARVVRTLGALRPDASFYTSGIVTPAMRRGVAGLLATRGYAAVVTELGMSEALPRRCDVPIVYSSHNCEAALLFRRARLEPWWSRGAVALDAMRVRGLEARLVERSIGAIVCSQNDVDDTAAFAPSFAAKSVIIPNGVDCASYAHVSTSPGKPGTVLITGSFDWVPNRRGLTWFLDDVLPLLRDELGATPFEIRVAGRMSADYAKRLDALPNVVAVPNVPRMDVELAAARVVAVPVVASSGTRLRILEAWAAGRPIVTTVHGAFGLAFTDGVDLCVRSSPLEFARGIAEVLADDRRQLRMRAAGLARAAEHDWSAIGARLDAAFARFVPDGEVPFEPARAAASHEA